MARCTKTAQCRARCTKAAQCRARCTKVVAGPGRLGGVCRTGIARASASGQLPQQVRCMASCVQAASLVLMLSQALRRWQGTLRQPQGAAGGGAPAGGGWSMRTGHDAAATCSRHACVAAMQAANGQSQAETDRRREVITAVIAAGWHAQLLPPTPSLPCLFISIFLLPLKSFYPLYFLSLPIFGCGLHARVI